TRPAARVVDDKIGGRDIADNRGKELLDVGRLGRIARIGARIRLGAERGEFLGAARRQRDTHTFFMEKPRKRCAETCTSADDKCGLSHWTGSFTWRGARAAAAR